METLLYCEILSALRESLVNNRVPASLSNGEKVLLDFCESRAELIQAPFAQRLDRAADWLHETDCDSDSFSQLVHERFLNEANLRLSRSDFRGRTIVVLVDNLDKTWGPGSDTRMSLIMPLSLLGLQRRIGRELGKNMNVNLVAFLRRNMFELILESVREPDKLLSDAVELVWDEPRTLLNVIDERFKASSTTHIGYEVDPWTTFFPPTIEGIPTQQWILKNIVPRPRDLIHLVRRAIEIALNRNHSAIEETDLVDARRDYSLFASEQIVSEYQVENKLLKSITRLFEDMESEMTVKRIFKHIERTKRCDLNDSPKVSGMNSDNDILKTILMLVGAGFFGIRLGKGTDVRYASSTIEARALKDVVESHYRRGRLTLSVNPVYRLGLANSQSGDTIASFPDSDTFNLVQSIRTFVARLR